MKRYLSSRHAAEYLDLSYRAFDVWVRRYGVPHLRLGRQRRFEPAVLDQVLRTMSQRPGLRPRLVVGGRG